MTLKSEVIGTWLGLKETRRPRTPRLLPKIPDQRFDKKESWTRVQDTQEISRNIIS